MTNEIKLETFKEYRAARKNENYCRREGTVDGFKSWFPTIEEAKAWPGTIEDWCTAMDRAQEAAEKLHPDWKAKVDAELPQGEIDYGY